MEEYNYKILKQDKFPTHEAFLEMARNYGKAAFDEDGNL